MIFENGRHTRHDFLLTNTVLEVVKNVQIPLCLFKNGNLYRTQNKRAQKSLFALHNLFIVFNRIELDIQLKLKIFGSLVGSILNYGAEIMFNTQSNDIEKVHWKFLRTILVVRKSTNLDAIYGDLGRHPRKVHRQIIDIKY